MKIKQYINNNKQILIMFFTLMPFLIVYSVAYCNPMLIMTVLPGISNKVIDKIFDVAPYFTDKAIAATPYVAYGTGWVVVGSALTLTSIKVAEYAYNWRYIANLTTSNIPIIGWTARQLQWGYELITRTQIEPVEYTHFFPKIASALGDPTFFTKKIIFDLSNQKLKVSTDKDLERVVEKTKYEFIDRVAKEIEYRDRPVYTPIIEYVEKPVYVPHPVYRDRENLFVLGEKIDKLTYITNESNLAHIGLHNGYAQLKDEIVLLVDSNKKKNVNLQKIAFYGEESLGIYYEYSDGSRIALAKTDFQYTFLLTMFNTFVEYNQRKYGFFRPEEQENMYNCPTIELSYSNATFFNSPQLQLDKTLVTRIFCQDNMFLFDQGINFFMENNTDLLRIQTDQQKLTCELRQIVNDGLLIKETTNQGTQTIDFGVNAAMFENIITFLTPDEQAKIKFVTRDGELLHLDKESQEVIQTNKTNQKTTTTMEMSAQTEYTTNEDFGALAVNTVDSSLFQNMATLFSVVLVGIVASDIQSAELLARTLLGFTHLPEYNDAFVVATHMSVEQLQSQYNFGLEEAKKAYSAIKHAHEMRYTESIFSDTGSIISDNVEEIANSINWKQLLITGALIAGTITIGYLTWQAVKNGLPLEGINTNVKTFEEEILKGIK